MTPAEALRKQQADVEAYVASLTPEARESLRANLASLGIVGVDEIATDEGTTQTMRYADGRYVVVHTSAVGDLTVRSNRPLCFTDESGSRTIIPAES